MWSKAVFRKVSLSIGLGVPGSERSKCIPSIVDICVNFDKSLADGGFSRSFCGVKIGWKSIDATEREKLSANTLSLPGMCIIEKLNLERKDI